ncbi:MAG: prepilin-type N-terminal cleavage/methylation domain-containing protein [Armatimonadetes bacterium]|nr:prepilin-type N-terminal cleavage/methylation domain-containing protein [Armatimonadota bacterium]
MPVRESTRKRHDPRGCHVIAGRTRSKTRGFTLIELMIVIIIIAILAAIMVPSLVRARYQAHLTSCQNTLRSIAAACEVYHTDSHSYPAALDATFFQEQMGRGSIPTCPSSDTAYAYDVAPDGDDFLVFCEDGIHYLLLNPIVDEGFPQYSPDTGVILKPLP